MFIANMDELLIRERETDERKAATAKRRGEEGGEEGAGAIGKDDDEEDSDAEEEKEKEKEKEPKTVFSFERKSRAEVAADKQGKGGGADDEDDEEDKRPKGILAGLTTKNPNKEKKPGDRNIKIKDLKNMDMEPVNETAGMTKKDKEVHAAAKAKEDYMKRHLAGETEEAKKQLEMLAIVKARREAAAAARIKTGRAAGSTAVAETAADSSSSEEEGSDSDEDSDDGDVIEKKNKAAVKQVLKQESSSAASVKDAKRAAAAGTTTEAKKDGSEKLKPMDIKKMNGSQLKEKLKERGLNVQGQKNDLIKRLCDFEALPAKP